MKELSQQISTITQSVIRNLITSIFCCNGQLTYIVEGSAWSIQEDGKAITQALRRQHRMRARISTTTIGLRKQMIQFGSVNTFFKNGTWQKPRHGNTHVLTWFHGVPDDPRLKLINQAQRDLAKIHTSCTLTKEALVREGVDPKKIVIIPLGIDLQLFTPVDDEKRRTIRDELGIPQGALVIGSFQKDGIGWGEGNEPKLIKGPDIFVKVILCLKHLNPFVLFTGPARGYVKQELKKRGISYRHIYLKKFHDLPRMYHAIDLYLITSRIEGGPKALLESWASGIPVVSTRVGMVPDIAEHNQTALLTEIEQIDHLTQQTERLFRDETLRKTLTQNALKKVQGYEWNLIAREYFEKIYRPLL